MISVYNVDKVVYLKHIAEEEGVICHTVQEVRKQEEHLQEKQKQRTRNQGLSDNSAQLGPPDRVTNFTGIALHIQI